MPLFQLIKLFNNLKADENDKILGKIALKNISYSGSGFLHTLPHLPEHIIMTQYVKLKIVLYVQYRQR